VDNGIVTGKLSDADGVLQPRSPRAGRWLQRTTTTVLWMLLAGAVYSASVPVWFRIHSWQVVTLVSGSMAPTYPTGTDLIMAKVADPTSMQAGDVITVTEGTGLPVTHRVAERVLLPSGVTYRMKGDANRTADPVLVSADKVIGKIDRAVPVWAEMAIWIERTNMRFIVFGLPLVWLLAIEFTSFLKEWKGRTRADSEQTTAGGSAGSGSGDAGR
jgi:signal peptidase I